MKEIERVRVRKFAAGARDESDPRACGEDEVAAEEPLEIRVNGRPIAVTMRTPGADAELAAGFLFSEGVVARAEDLVELRAAGESANCNAIDAILGPGVAVDFESLTRHVFASSSCGLCGKATIAAVHRRFPPVGGEAGRGTKFAAEAILAMPERLRAAQPAFDRTGGLHAAGIFDAEGNLLVAREDVGRHNAADKAIGWGLLNGRLPFEDRAMAVSGRASFEIVQKALAARIAVVVAVSAPSSLAIRFARESGQTLVGFARGGTMNVYSGEESIL